MAFFAAGALLPTSLSFAQAKPEPPTRRSGADKPAARTAARADTYARLAEEIQMEKGEAEKLVVSLQRKGFSLRDVISLLILAKERAEQVIWEKKAPRAQYGGALRASVALLAGIAEKEGFEEWDSLIKKSGVEVSLRELREKTVAIMSPPGRPGTDERGRMVIVVPDHLPEKGRKMKAKAPPEPERLLPREEVLKNMAAEFPIDLKTVAALVTRLEGEMVFRETIRLLVVANALTEQQLQRGKVPNEKREQSFSANVDAILALVRKDTGWGDLGSRLGLKLTGANINHKVDVLIGQE